ncbi:hypothetical protein MtrunA17_Chr3g0087571 [Medicago truncatula]|nr:hypothetical protein MtrunA17_Chr3g0087571 [Medicago truncatula]
MMSGQGQPSRARVTYQAQRIDVGWRQGVRFWDDVVIRIVVFKYKLCTVNPNLSLIIQRNCSFSTVGDVGNIGRTSLPNIVFSLFVFLNWFAVLTYIYWQHTMFTLEGNPF